MATNHNSRRLLTDEERKDAKEFYKACKILKLKKQTKMGDLFRTFGMSPTTASRVGEGILRAPDNWREMLKKIAEELPDREFKPRGNDHKIVVVLHLDHKDIYYASNGSGLPLREIGPDHPWHERCKEIWESDILTKEKEE